MSRDDIIRSWKASAEAPKNEDTAPDSPVGDAELPDSELDSVSGGNSTESCMSVGCCTAAYCPTGKYVCNDGGESETAGLVG
jgi:mersacidin/lichenicidin family type 2 lantibiotic